MLKSEAKSVYNYYEDNLRRLTGNVIKEFEAYLLMLYGYGATRMTAGWAKTGMKAPVEYILMADKLALPTFVQKVFFSDKPQ